MISEKKLQANRKNIEKANKSGKNRHFGKDNTKWNNGNRLKGNFPCPQCGKDRMCEKRDFGRICLDCHRNRESKFNWNEWREKVKKISKEFAIKYKGGKCEMCNVSDLPDCCYHFHHLRDKEFSIGTKLNQKISEKIIKELDKCILLCANCHAIKHWTK